MLLRAVPTFVGCRSFAVLNKTTVHALAQSYMTGLLKYKVEAIVTIVFGVFNMDGLQKDVIAFLKVGFLSCHSMFRQ